MGILDEIFSEPIYKDGVHIDVGLPRDGEQEGGKPDKPKSYEIDDEKLKKIASRNSELAKALGVEPAEKPNVPNGTPNDKENAGSGGEPNTPNDEPNGEVQKSFAPLKKKFDPLQPRGDNGRWIDTGAMQLAATDPQVAAHLMRQVTKPEQRKLLVAQLKKFGMTEDAWADAVDMASHAPVTAVDVSRAGRAKKDDIAAKYAFPKRMSKKQMIESLAAEAEDHEAMLSRIPKPKTDFDGVLRTISEQSDPNGAIVQSLNEAIANKDFGKVMELADLLAVDASFDLSEVKNPFEVAPVAAATGAALDPKEDWKQNKLKSQSFKQWFGDWEGDPANASKVVAADGTPEEQHEIDPVVMYHGTAVGGFEEFDQGQDKGRNLFGKGFYFTNDKEIAEAYTKKDSDYKNRRTAARGFYEVDGETPIDKFDNDVILHLLSGKGIPGKENEYPKPGVLSNPNWDWSNKIALDEAMGPSGVDVKAYLDTLRSDLTGKKVDHKGELIKPDNKYEYPDNRRAHGKIPGEEISYFVDQYNAVAEHLGKPRVEADVAEPELFEVYLNIRNPMDMNKTIGASDVDKFMKAYDNNFYLDNVMDSDRFTSLTGLDVSAHSDQYDYDKVLKIKQHMYDRRHSTSREPDVYSRGWAEGDPVFKALHLAGDRDTLTWGDLNFIMSNARGGVDGVAQKLGFDGIRHTGGWNIGAKEHDVWIAFEPTQIKSIENEGTFDPSNPKIKKALDTSRPWDESKYRRDPGGRFDNKAIAEWSASLSDRDRGLLSRWGTSGRDIRNAQAGKDSSVSQQTVDEFKRLLDGAPKYEGVVYRGLSQVPQDVVSQWTKGAVIELHNDQSASRESGDAKKFSGEGSWGDKVTVMMEIDQRSGAWVENETGVYYGGDPQTGFVNEKEVILRKGSKYVVEDAGFYLPNGERFEYGGVAEEMHASEMAALEDRLAILKREHEESVAKGTIGPLAVMHRQRFESVSRELEELRERSPVLPDGFMPHSQRRGMYVLKLKEIA